MTVKLAAVHSGVKVEQKNNKHYHCKLSNYDDNHSTSTRQSEHRERCLTLFFFYIARPADKSSVSGNNLVSVLLANASLWTSSKEIIVACTGQYPHSHLENKAGTSG